MTANSQIGTRYIVFILLLSAVYTSYGQVKDDITRSGKSFLPDATSGEIKPSDFQTYGNVQWKVEKGVITVSSKKQNNQGLLLFKRPFQDVAMRALFKVEAASEFGFLFRAERKESTTQGLLISVKGNELTASRASFDEAGRLLTRDELWPARGIIRIAPQRPEKTENKNGNQRARGSVAPTLNVPLQRPSTDYKPGDWNQVEMIIDLDIVRAFLNDGMQLSQAVDDQGAGYGPVGLYFAGAGTANISDLAFKDVAVRYTPKEQTAERFNVQQISDMFYAWSATAADFDKDGHTDIGSGPYIYYGPDYTRYTEIYAGFAYNPSSEFPTTNCEYSFDFDQDGWTDILFGAPQGKLYLNPRGASRRWESYQIVPSIQSEVSVFADLDRDARPELIDGTDKTVRYAKFDPANPSQPWQEYIVSDAGYFSAHGIGAGDINGDGRVDIVNPHGWWEQPDRLDSSTWQYHSVSLSRYGHRTAGLGGSVMAVYDVNGDGKNDVVTGLNAHGFGLAWFEQKKTGDEITFVRHMIMDDYSTQNAGGVTFSQLHGATFSDVDGDGILDFIVGKRYFSHLDNYFDPDPYGAPCVYWYRTIRDSNAPGGARFEPELVHNRSGVGSDVLAYDLDKDGNVEIITSTNRGAFIFWNTGKKKR